MSVFIIGCGKKGDQTVNKENSEISGLIMKDSITGKEKVMLKYVLKKGDKFVYKMTAKTSTTENSPATQGKDENQDNEINYYYTKEVQDVDASGIITYKVQYDSITITAKMNDQTVKYSSNVNDTVKSNPAFLQYNSVIKEPFFIRVTSDGEITDIYGLEKIHENLFKALGDTLKEEEKQNIKESFGKDSMREILQQEYQMFPKQPVFMDSSWIKSYNTQLMLFDVVNSAKYTLKSIEDKDNQKVANIEAVQNVEFLNKEVKQRGVKFSIENSETSGIGKITFNINKGCITNKETTTTLNLDMKMSAQGQAAKSVQKVKTNLLVTLLN
jgi:Ni,Fe-hydrogenase III component G